PKGFEELSQFEGWQIEALGYQHELELKAVVVFVIQKESGFKSFLSKRCIIFSGPVFTNEESLKFLMSSLKQLIGGCVYCEIRNGYPTERYASSYQSLGWQYIPWFNFIVPTTDGEVMWSRVSESRRRQLKKAEKAGAYVANPKDEKEVKSFYKILSQLYSKKVKKPLPGYDLFRHYFELDNRNFVLVYLKGEVIGGILCPFLESVGIYEFYVAGLDQDFKDCYPSAMATYGAMEQGNRLGIPMFDFMGGGSPNEGYGVREFKSRFGGNQVEWGRWLLVKNKFLYQLGKWYIQRRSR
ncbi:MAG: hypothetical protein RLZZ205_256, partial [Bacteroidota bacterium]